MITAPDLTKALDGELFHPDSPGYEAVRRPADGRFRDIRPQLVVQCRSVSDVVLAIQYARETGTRLVPRSGGHCFAGRSTTTGILLDLSELNDITLANDGLATVGAGTRLAPLYAALHAHGRTIPAGCGATVGIAGLTLGGGIGLLGRTYGLTCDRLVRAQVVLADGRVVACDRDREPDLFWALRGAGGGQFGVVTSLVFDTVAEPAATRIEARWSLLAVEEIAEIIAAWQRFAPGLADDVTVNLTVVAEPGRHPRAALFGASLQEETATRDLLRRFREPLKSNPVIDVRGGFAYHHLKHTFADLEAREATEPRADTESPVRIRSEFFAHPMRPRTIEALASALVDNPDAGPRRLTFTAMAGAYNHVASDATAFAHRGAHFLLEHVAEPRSAWIDQSWRIAHADGSGGVYPNFPDPGLDDWAAAYHAGNYARLAAIKRAYDPGRFFDFPQSV